MTTHRTIKYKLYPNKAQDKRLHEVKTLHCRLYNAALEQRRDAWGRRGVSLSRRDQSKELTQLRRESDDYRSINAQASHETLTRLERAFEAFFRRIKAGQKAGHPRFKSSRRYRGWTYPTHGNGWKLRGDIAKHPRLYLQEIGVVKTRGRCHIQGTPKTCTIEHRQGTWYASVVFECEGATIPQSTGRKAIGLDWGLTHYITTIDQDGRIEQVDNPRFLRRSLDKLRLEQRKLSRKKMGSCNWDRQRLVVAKLYGKIQRQRSDWLHKLSTRLVRENALIATETLNVQGMRAKGGAYKKGLNRAIVGAAPGVFLAMLRYKAEGAGVEFVEVNTRKVKPSQTCSACGHQKKKTLSERVHACAECGLWMDRDANAARVMLNVALFETPCGREPAKRGGGQLCLL